MSLHSRLAASTPKQSIAILRITLIELANALCRLAHDEGLPRPYRIKFKDRNLLPWLSRVAELRIGTEHVWIKEPEARHFHLPISGTLTSADGRAITLNSLE